MVSRERNNQFDIDFAPTFARAADGTKAMTSNNNAHRAISTHEKRLINAFPKSFMLPPLDDKDAGYESSGGDIFLCKEFSNMSGHYIPDEDDYTVAKKER